MELTPEYLAENSEVVTRNFKGRYWLKQNPRWNLVKKFVDGANTILSVGCGSTEPVIIGATHAIDIVPESLTCLKRQGWKGHFRIASVTDLPLPDKCFDVVVCSEVIEHLPEIKDIEDAFKELDRVGKKWIATTPAHPLGPKNIEPTHKRFLDLDTLKKLTSKYKVKVFKDGNYNIVMKEL